LFGVLPFGIEAEGFHLGGPRRVVLAQGVAHPGGWQQDAPQVGMALEGDSEHVPDLAFIPVGRGPDIRNRGQGGVFILKRYLDPDHAVAIERKQMIDQAEVAFGLILTIDTGSLVDGGQVI